MSNVTRLKDLKTGNEQLVDMQTAPQLGDPKGAGGYIYIYICMCICINSSIYVNIYI